VIVCPSCGKENPEEARFCLACGSPVAEAPEPPAPAGPSEERKLVTVLFVDVVGSTARAEQLDPEDVKSMLAPYHARAGAELERFGGRVEKFVGDAVLAIFGAPIAYEDDPERAVRAALAIKEGVADLNAQDAWLDLHIRIGVHTGEALVMLDARPDQGEWTAAGDVMNTAARLQSSAPTDGILVGQETYNATRGVIEYRDHEPIAAKGKADPVQVWEVVGVREGRNVAAAAAPLVGRERELEQIWGVWERIEQERRPGFAAVVGGPGIGKSRLIAETAARLQERCDVLWGRCLSYGEGITYWPIVEILKQAARITHDDDETATSAKLGELLSGLATEDRDELRTMAAALANLIGVATTPEGTYSAEEIGQAELHWGIRRVLELVAARRPLVLVLEDLHWAEPTLIELVETLLEGGEGSPVLLLCSARPEAPQAWPALFADGEHRRTVELEALGAGASEALLAELLREKGLPPEVAARVLENAGGNPLFIEETVSMLSDAGALGDGDVGSLPVPTSLQALIGSRLDQLAPSGKMVAQQASVIGTVFWPGAVAHLGANGALAPGLSELERRDLVRANRSSTVAGENEYAFKHVLIRDVAYGRVTKGERARLHARFATWTQELPGGEDELVEIVAYHLEQACLFARAVAHPPEPPPIADAVEALIRAAEKSERREGHREAERFYSRALDVVEESERELELRLKHSRSLTSLGELRRASEQLARLADETLAAGRLDLRCAALIALANIDSKQGRASEGREHILEAQSIATQIGDPVLEIRARYESADLRAWFEGEDRETIEDLRSGLAIAEELDDLALRIEGHMRLGFLLFNLGKLGESEEHLESCARLAREMGSHRDEARVTFLLAVAKHYRGERAEARRLSLQALDWLDRTADSYFQVQNLRALALYALAEDDLEEAEERLKAAVPLALESGGWLVLEIYRLLVESLVRQQRVGEARELAEFAARNVPEEDVYSRAALLLAEASVAVADGDVDAVLDRYPQALLLLEEQRLLIDLAEGRIAFGRALNRFGRDEEATTQFHRAHEILAPMGARALVEEIERELTAFPSPATAAAQRPEATG
jgi:class 3 adenylate cyclase/tetratricopeptide (TPR) repeat protein